MHDSSKSGLTRAYKIIRAAIDREKHNPSSADYISDLEKALRELYHVLVNNGVTSELELKPRGRKPNGIPSAHNSMVAAQVFPTINSWTPKVDIDTVITCYANVYVAKDTSGSIWNTFVNAYNELNETERDAIYSELCNISNSNPPFGFEPIGESNGEG